MNKTFVTILILLSLLGIAISAILLSQHYRHLSQGFDQKSFCSINEFIDCDVIDSSEYSTLFSIPVSGLSLLFYILTLIYSLLAMSLSPKKRGGLIFCLGPGLIAILVTLMMMYLSFFNLKVLCLLCAALYVINFLIVGFLPYAAGFKLKNLPSMAIHYVKALRNRPNSLGFKPNFFRHAVFSCIVLVVGGLILLQTEKSVKAQANSQSRQINKINKDINTLTLDDIIKFHLAQKPIPIRLNNLPVKGTPNSKVTIVEFSDYECPFCGRAADFFKEFVEQYKDQVSFYYVNYPLDKSCNADMKQELHRYACQAAAASLCAQKKDKFWEYHDILFKNMDKLTDGDLLSYAEQLGIESPWMKQCMQSFEIKQRLDDDMRLAREVRIQGTPSVFVNGRPVQGWMQKEFMDALIAAEIKQK